jgi:hypothetical protein
MEIIEVLQGMLSLTLVVVFIAAGGVIASKYRPGGDRTMLVVGIVWMGMCTPWLHGALSFPLAFFTGRPLPDTVRFFIALAFLPPVTVLWIDIFGEMFYEERRRLLTLFFGLCGAVFEGLLLSALFAYPEDPVWGVGVFTGLFQARWSIFPRAGVLFFLATALSTGIVFGYKTFRMGGGLGRLRGSFILCAFPLYAVGSVLDSAIPLHPVGVVLTRLVLVTSALSFYIAFSPPEFVVRWFE